MIKLLIADDEPLVQIGLKSMIDWESLGIDICGTAANGDMAFQMIKEQRPEIVITDIQMPCSSGLELGKQCREALGKLPVFIILTGYENFHYAREAMSFQAVDYLVKIDLTAKSLTSAVKRAIEQVETLSQENHIRKFSSDTSLLLFQERFYIRLLNNLFESQEQLLRQSRELKISLDYPGFTVAYMELLKEPQKEDSDKSLMRLYSSTLHMLQELLSKYVACKVVALDTQYLAVVFYLTVEQKETWKETIRYSIKQVLEMLHNYYSVSILTSVGRLAENPGEIFASYNDARQLTGYLSPDKSLLFWDEQSDSSTLKNVFNLSLFRDEIGKAFQEMDEKSLCSIFENIIGLLSMDNLHFSQAMDAAGSILHLAVTLLSNGTAIVSRIFQEEPDSYRSLYHLNSVPAIIQWLEKLKNGLCSAFREYNNTQKNYLVENSKHYIREHIHERIVLLEIADTFGVSANYLRQLVKKYEGIGISEYVTQQKIQLSKELLKEGKMKIYEIADLLGFESAFYFSKVFKKVTGLSPKDYRNQ